MYIPNGAGTALITPFNDDGVVDELGVIVKQPTIDWGALLYLVDEQIRAGMDFLVLCGTTGESPPLSIGEQVAITKRVCKHVGPKATRKIKIVAGTGANTTTEALKISKGVANIGENGVDAIMVVVPYYNKPPVRDVIRYFEQIKLAVGDIPIILYDIPGRTGIMLPAVAILDLMRRGIIHSLKWASGDFNQLIELLTYRPPHVTILSGDDALTEAVIRLGGDGVISVVSHVIPEAIVKLVRELNLKFKFAKNEPWAIAAYTELMNLMFVVSNPVPVKTAMAELHPDVIKPVFRDPLGNMEPEMHEKFVARLRELTA